eukprot:GHUV01042857.1.p2 GENE.GHUV01042857.1~~GHUV01042857.1.p2  ORF type:complete len:108 (+),score=33.52 GHUV01042857.1:130-453(+)
MAQLAACLMLQQLCVSAANIIDAACIHMHGDCGSLQVTDFPTDVDFKWAQDSYNVTQRTADTWLFFAVFRSRLWLLDQKWSYPGGYTGLSVFQVPHIMSVTDTCVSA